MSEQPANLVGVTVASRYHLVRQLGDGGMGAVYKAADQVLRRFVAVKLLHKSTAANPAAVERFVREARSAASIGHPNIIEIIDFGNDAGQPFLVMEYLKGRPLSQAIGVEAPFRVARAASIATHALAGLAAAHSRGILHRDLKPANLMLVSRLGERDFVKVCDFGFATLLAPKSSIHDGTSLTPARTLVGTPAYAAPERLRGDDRPDARIDVYAIGVVLFEMLTGRRPFDAPSFAELANKVKNDPPPKVSSFRKDVPPGLDEVVLKALAKERDKRWSSAEAFAAALVPYGGRRVDIAANDDDDPSDIFTMDVLRLRARETQHKHRITLTGEKPGLTRPVTSDPGLKPNPPTSSIEIHVSVDDGAPPSTVTQTDPSNRPPDLQRATLVDASPFAVSPEAAHVREFPLDTRRGALGSLVLATLRFVQARFGPRAIRDVLASLPPQVAPIFQRGVAATDFIPLGAYESLTHAIDQRLGSDDMQLLVNCGRAAGEALEPAIREVNASPSAEMILVELPRVVAKAFRGMGMRSRSIGRGYATVEVVDNADHQLGTCVTMLGLVERCVAVSNARDLEVSCVTCKALGDDDCVMHVSWFAS